VPREAARKLAPSLLGWACVWVAVQAYLVFRWDWTLSFLVFRRCRQRWARDYRLLLAREAWGLHCMMLLSDLRVRPLPRRCRLDLPFCYVEVRWCQVDLLTVLVVTRFDRLCPYWLPRWELRC
jgi:hypothetical protein